MATTATMPNNSTKEDVRIIANSTDPKVASGNPSLAAQQSSSLNATEHQVTAETGPLPTLPTVANRVAEAFENEMQDSIGVKVDDSVALIAIITAKMKESEILNHTLQVVQPLKRRKRGRPTKKRSGETGPSSSRRKTRTRNSALPSAVLRKIKAPAPASIPVIDREYDGLIGYQPAWPKSDETPPSSARRPHLHSRDSIKFDPYPIDPTRTYPSVLN